MLWLACTVLVSCLSTTYAAAPAIPVGLGVADVPYDQGGALRLSWTANTEGDLKDYGIYRATYTGFVVGAATPIARVAAPGTTHQQAGLTNGATYYYRLTALNTLSEESAGSSEVSAYPVDDPPSAPMGLNAADVPSDQGFAVRISWTSNTEAALKDYGIYRATFSGLLFTKILKTRVAAPGTTHQDEGLTNGTPYYYQITARDVNLNESGAAADFSVTSQDNLAPASPGGLMVVDPGTPGTGLNLSWAANTEGDLKDYRVRRATFVGVGIADPVIATIAAPGTTHQDGGLTTGTRYNYRLTARDVSLNESGLSAEGWGVPGAPAAPGGLGVSDVPADGGTALSLSWTAGTEADLKDYGLYRATWAGASPAPTPTRIATPGTTHQASGLISGSTYYFRLTARDTSGNESGYSAEVSAAPADNVPAIPSGAVVSDVLADQGFALRLSWLVNPDTDLKDYRIRRTTFVGVGMADPVVATIAAPGTTHQDGGLANGTTFYYRLTARDLAGQESAGSAEGSVRLRAHRTYSPPEPSRSSLDRRCSRTAGPTSRSRRCLPTRLAPSV